jgi:hypothetical protein
MAKKAAARKRYTIRHTDVSSGLIVIIGHQSMKAIRTRLAVDVSSLVRNGQALAPLTGRGSSRGCA